MVEKLFHAAAPKLLKILEEPPDKTLFLLVSENHDQIISTILSRTQPVKFKKLDDAVILEVLRARTGRESEDIREVAKLAGGNVRLAIRLADEQSDGALFALFSKWMRLCYQQKVAEISDFVDEIAPLGRERQKNFLLYALRFIRECLMMPYNDPRLVNLTEEEQQFATNFAPFVNRANGNSFTEEFNRSLQHIERNASPQILFTDLSLTVSRLLKVKPAG
jgi:DNA polymerase-3 subunit delta'